MTIDLHYVNYDEDQQRFTLIRKLPVHHLIGNSRKYLEVPCQIYYEKDVLIRMKLIKIKVNGKQFDPNSYGCEYEIRNFVEKKIEGETNG